MSDEISRSAPEPETVLLETLEPETSASVTTFVDTNGVLRAPDEVTDPIGDVSATPFLSINRPKNDGLAAPSWLIATSSPSLLTNTSLELSAELTAETPVSLDTLLIAIAKFDKFVGVTSAEMTLGTRLAASSSKDTTPLAAKPKSSMRVSASATTPLLFKIEFIERAAEFADEPTSIGIL